MLITKFYDIINAELSGILAENSTDVRTKEHKKVDENKGYALLIWFLKFYAQENYYAPHITDGTGDMSCDIIFSSKNASDEVVFYVIQSKNVVFDSTKKKENEFPKIKKEEFNAVINDFSVLLSSDSVASKNEKFTAKYQALKKHLASNGKAKFIFFTLAQENDAINDSITAFNTKNAPNITLEVIDIEKIRRDYIEFIYKEVKIFNRLEYDYSPELRMVNLPIERFKEGSRDIFEFEGRNKAYTFLLKPKTVHDLFKRYGFSLFFKNVRNPIHRSNYNPKIVETLLNRPSSFWYFNNGITAITSILPSIGNHAKKIDIGGLQIINGAQTVYSIYTAYSNAKPIERKIMDNEARIALRLIGSSDKDFNLQITRYTNLQNPMEDRDFWANEDIQQRLQNESFGTDTWYEKRKDEFQLSEAAQMQLGVKIIPNTEFVMYYVAFHLQKPTYAASRQSDFFISKKDNKNGLYEEIFNEKTKFEDMYASLLISTLLIKSLGTQDENGRIIIDKFLIDMSFPSIALCKIIAQQYFAVTRATIDKEMNINLHLKNINKNQKREDIIEITKILQYSHNLVVASVRSENEQKIADNMMKLLTNADNYDNLVKKILEEGIDIEKIKAIEIPN